MIRNVITLLKLPNAIHVARQCQSYNFQPASQPARQTDRQTDKQPRCEVGDNQKGERAGCSSWEDAPSEGQPSARGRTRLIASCSLRLKRCCRSLPGIRIRAGPSRSRRSRPMKSAAQASGTRQGCCRLARRDTCGSSSRGVPWGQARLRPIDKKDGPFRPSRPSWR